MEDGIARMHVAGVSVFEGPAPAVGDLGNLLTSKLHLIPRYGPVFHAWRDHDQLALVDGDRTVAEVHAETAAHHEKAHQIAGQRGDDRRNKQSGDRFVEAILREQSRGIRADSKKLGIR